MFNGDRVSRHKRGARIPLVASPRRPRASRYAGLAPDRIDQNVEGATRRVAREGAASVIRVPWPGADSIPRQPSPNITPSNSAPCSSVRSENPERNSDLSGLWCPARKGLEIGPADRVGSPVAKSLCRLALWQPGDPWLATGGRPSAVDQVSSHSQAATAGHPTER